MPPEDSAAMFESIVADEARSKVAAEPAASSEERRGGGVPFSAAGEPGLGAEPGVPELPPEARAAIVSTDEYDNL